MIQYPLKSSLIASALAVAAMSSAFAADHDNISFEMVVSAGARNCLPDAKAEVNIVSTDTAEDMFIHATGLPPNTDFDFFVIQVPTAPFGLSWYQGDVKTNHKGEAVQHFRGRFNIETFIFAQGPAPAPLVFNDPPFPDAATNPTTNPVQTYHLTYHLGLWFDSHQDAQNNGCPATVTPFNGEHNAGIQVLNTSNFPIGAGPLRSLNP